VTRIEPLELRSWFDEHVHDALGVGVLSTSPQPVHVVNGLLRHAVGDPRAAGAAVAAVASAPGGLAYPPEHVRARADGTLPGDDADLAAARAALRGLLAADGAVFRRYASFQIAHPALITNDPTDLSLGELAARLALEHGRARGALTRFAARLADPQPNPHWAAQAALADVAAQPAPPPAAPAADGWWADTNEGRPLARELGGLLRRAADLAAADTDALLAVHTLAQSATWAGLISYAQAPTLLGGGTLRPLLCQVAPPGALPTVRAASAQALSDVHAAFRRWVTSMLVSEVEVRFAGREPSRAALRSFLSGTIAFRETRDARNVQEQVLALYEQWRETTQSTAQAAAFALYDTLAAGLANKPQKWFAAVGRHCGFVGPRRGGGARLRVEQGLLPTLVLAGISANDGETVPFARWSRRLADRFGVLVGPDARTRAMHPRASEDELAANARALTDALAALGLARRYSDAVTDVLNPQVLWERA